MQPNARARILRISFYAGLILLVVPGVLRAYLLSPPGGSQDLDLLPLAYYAFTIHPFAVASGLLLLLPHIIMTIRTKEQRLRVGLIFLCVALLGFNYFLAVKLGAANTFREVQKKVFATAAENRVATQSIVIGVEHNGVAKAYPITILGLHYRLADTVGGTPVLATYSLLCRTGRVYATTLDGVVQAFDLVGMQHYNGVLADHATRSWWYQATGQAVMGPRAGRQLQEMFSEQMTLAAWIARHPNTLVLQPDSSSANFYKELSGFAHARTADRDASGRVVRWQDFGWVVGLVAGGTPRAYDWNDLLEHRVLNDQPGGVPVVIALEPDTTNFHAWKRLAPDAAHEFLPDSAGRGMRDRGTNSLWDWTGACIEGACLGQHLEALAARQEYWLAWRTFNRGTTQWAPAAK
ncbi:MAG TPA: DUF3179 domain-containing (seleno)protein [Candidatus Kapabacteria bacterium]|nr:DUF3179 domain-containing (seleno)protein [Candidatus Kapabacteria bacterium]